MTEITLDNGKTYQLDVDKAIADGCLKEKLTPIKEIKTGDVFKCVDGLCSDLFIIQLYGSIPGDLFFAYYGLYGGLEPFYMESNVEGSGLTKNEIITWLNKHNYKKVGNLNSQVKKAFLETLDGK